MAILKRIKKLLGLNTKKIRKIPSMYVSELDLTKGFMVISDISSEKIISIDLHGQRGYGTLTRNSLTKFSKSCSDIRSNRIIGNDDKCRVEIRQLSNKD